VSLKKNNNPRLYPEEADHQNMQRKLRRLKMMFHQIYPMQKQNLQTMLKQLEKG
jgi:ABC-type phosphate transport system auxiliary subunit